MGGGNIQIDTMDHLDSRVSVVRDLIAEVKMYVSLLLDVIVLGCSEHALTCVAGCKHLASSLSVLEVTSD